MNRTSFYIRQKKNDEAVYTQVDGYTFDWNDRVYGLWHKDRGEWIIIDIKSGMSVIKVPNRRDLEKYLTADLAKRLNTIYKKPFYKQACDALWFDRFQNTWSNYDENIG